MVNPIGNLQAMLPNSSEVGNLQNQMNHQAVNAQNFGNQKLQQQADDKQMQVYAKDEVEEEKIREDKDSDKGSGENSQGRRKKMSKPEKEEKKLTDAIRGHNIDIKL